MYWLAPRKDFDRAALVSTKVRPLDGDLFYLHPDEDQDNTELAGVNFEADINDKFNVPVNLGFTYMYALDSNNDGFFRADMDIFSVRAQGRPLPNWPNLFLSGEYVRQTGGNRTDIDADAWYAEAGWTASKLPWTPTLSYRYSQFSRRRSQYRRRRGFRPVVLRLQR